MPALARRPIEITVVGDIAVDEAIDAVAQTFGALARRDDAYAEPAGARDVTFPAQGKTVMLTHDGRRDQAILYLAWPGPDEFTDVPANHAFELLGQIIDNELTEMLRGQGKTYSPSSYAVSTPTFTGFGYLGVSVETSPQDLDGIKASVQQVIARLKAGSIPQDMIERARRPLIEDLAKYRKNNWYWRWSLNGLQRDPRRIAREQSADADYLGATGETLANLARQYRQDDRLVELRVLPAH
jgi:zinc protease